MYNYAEQPADQIEFIQVAGESDLPNGERLFLEIDDYRIVVFNVAGQYYAIGDICSHDDGPLGDGALENSEVVCPRHGARFDICSGEARSLPAVVDIPAYPVKIVDGHIEIGLPK